MRKLHSQGAQVQDQTKNDCLVIEEQNQAQPHPSKSPTLPFDGSFKAERMWNVDRLVESLGVTRSWVYDQTFRRKIPFRKIGGKLRFDPVELDAWIDTQPGCSLKISGSFAGRRKD